VPGAAAIPLQREENKVLKPELSKSFFLISPIPDEPVLTIEN
jgi:hypothetical protein